jgi:RNA polymerase sigma factor
MLAEEQVRGPRTGAAEVERGALATGHPASSAAADAEILGIIRRAQNGDRLAREELLALYARPAARIASRAVGRYIQVGHDDEASVALLAVDEAITCFDAARGRRFLSFAERVIRRRLVDAVRTRPPLETPFSAIAAEDDDGHCDVPALSRQALDLASAEVQAGARREEIARYAALLGTFDLSLADLVRVAPRHRDARRDAVAVGRLVAADPAMRAYLLEHRSLPLRAIEARVRLTRKTVERHRRYIIAVALVSRGEFPHLFEYLRDTPLPEAPTAAPDRPGSRARQAPADGRKAAGCGQARRLPGPQGAAAATRPPTWRGGP